MYISITNKSYFLAIGGGGKSVSLCPNEMWAVKWMNDGGPRLGTCPEDIKWRRTWLIPLGAAAGLSSPPAISRTPPLPLRASVWRAEGENEPFGGRGRARVTPKWNGIGGGGGVREQWKHHWGVGIFNLFHKKLCILISWIGWARVSRWIDGSTYSSPTN